MPIPVGIQRDAIPAERDRIATEVRTILDRSDGTLTPEDETTYNEAMADLDALRERDLRLAALERVAQLGDRATERANPHAPARVTPDRGPADDPWTRERALTREGPADLRSRALSAVERTRGMPDDARERVSRAIEHDTEPGSPLAQFTIETSRPDYLMAFGKWAADPVAGPFEWTPAERDAHIRVKTMARSLNITTGGSGAFMLPFTLDPQILIAGPGSVNPMRDVARVEQVATNEARFVTSLGVSASFDPESQEVSDDTPALLQPTLKNFKGMAFVPVTFEFFEDSGALPQIGEVFADAKAQLEANAFTLGTGTAEPKGVITAVSAVPGSVVSTSATGFAAAELYNNQAALPARWRANARWMMNLNVINGFRQVVAGTGLTTSIVDDSGPRPRVLGWDVHENSVMDGTITASAADYLILSGDFRSYCIVDRLGTSLEVVPHLLGTNRRPSGERGFLMHWRTGGDTLIPDSFRLTNYSA